MEAYHPHCNRLPSPISQILRAATGVPLMILLRCSLVWLMQCTLLPAPELPLCKEWYMQNCITTSAYVVEWSHSQTNTLTSILWYTDSMTVCYNSTDSMLQDTDKAWSCGSCKGRRISPPPGVIQLREIVLKFGFLLELFKESFSLP